MQQDDAGPDTDAPRPAQASVKFVQETFDMGAANFPCDKALVVSDAIEDEELLRKMALNNICANRK